MTDDIHRSYIQAVEVAIAILSHDHYNAFEHSRLSRFA